MIVTVMSDASFCPRTKAAGYGVWAKSDRGVFYCGGNFKGSVRHAQEAEAKALSIAVWSAFYQGVAKTGDYLVLQTDNLQNVRVLQGQKLEPGHRAAAPLKYCVGTLCGQGCQWSVRHVKAHAPHLGARNHVNGLCDRMARKAMVSQRFKQGN